MLPNLEPISLIAIANALYHSALAEKVPNLNKKKEDVISWLLGKTV